MSQNEQSVQIGVGDEVIFTRKKQKNLFSATAPYHRFGRAGMTRRDVEGVDMISIFKDLSKGGAWLFWRLVEVRNTRTNIAFFRSADMTPNEKRKTSAAYKELHALGVIARTKQNNYLINPKAILPESEDFANVWEMWEGFAG